MTALAKARQLHGKRMSKTWQRATRHGKCMATSMANAWHGHGKALATAWQRHGTGLATASHKHGTGMSKGKAKAWQAHGKGSTTSMATTLSKRGNQKQTWQRTGMTRVKTKGKGNTWQQAVTKRAWQRHDKGMARAWQMQRKGMETILQMNGKRLQTHCDGMAHAGQKAWQRHGNGIAKAWS
jgi:hypothetical protein